MANSSDVIDHYVSVVPVFDLDDVAQQRVGRHRVNEIDPCILETRRVRTAVLAYEEGIQVVDFSSSHLVARRRIRDHINHTGLVEPITTKRQFKPKFINPKRGTHTRSSGRDTVRNHLKVQPKAHEYVLELCDDLQSKLVLPTIVPDLEHRRLPRVKAAFLLLFIVVFVIEQLFLSRTFTCLVDLERGHKWSLQNEDAQSTNNILYRFKSQSEKK
jgi:hypothetical protein